MFEVILSKYIICCDQNILLCRLHFSPAFGETTNGGISLSVKKYHQRYTSYTVDTVETDYIVDTVYTVNSIDIFLHCYNISMYAYIYF